LNIEVSPSDLLSGLIERIGRTQSKCLEDGRIVTVIRTSAEL
jgi:hypothetical protein